MSSTDLGTVESTFIDVVEKFGYMFGVAIPAGDLPSFGDECFVAVMNFRGGIRGKLLLAMSQEACRVSAANILGLEPDRTLDPTRTADALKELLNVVCGRILHELVPGADFKLRPPMSERWTAADIEILKEKQGCYGFLLDDMPVLLRLELKGY